MTQIRRSWLLGLTVAGVCAPALRADVYQQFNVSGSVVVFNGDPSCDANGCPTGSLGGYLTIDTTVGRITGSDFYATNDGVTYQFQSPSTQGVSPVQYCELYTDGPCFYDTYYATLSSKNGASVDLYLDTSNYANGSLVGYGGGPICNEQDLCGGQAVLLTTMFYFPNGGDGIPYFASEDAALTPGALVTTPEPASFLLLGTGILGAAGAVRRRIRRV